MRRKKEIRYNIGGTLGGKYITIALTVDYGQGITRTESKDHIENLASTIARAISDKALVPISHFKFR